MEKAINIIIVIAVVIMAVKVITDHDCQSTPKDLIADIDSQSIPRYLIELTDTNGSKLFIAQYSITSIHRVIDNSGIGDKIPDYTAFIAGGVSYSVTEMPSEVKELMERN